MAGSKRPREQARGDFERRVRDERTEIDGQRAPHIVVARVIIDLKVDLTILFNSARSAVGEGQVQVHIVVRSRLERQECIVQDDPGSVRRGGCSGLCVIASDCNLVALMIRAAFRLT